MILKRPMFRRGGSSGEGITSGLAPRQNFDRGKLAQVQDQLRMLDVLAPAPKPRGSRAFNDFLINWGLNLGSTPPQGGLLSTAAATAKGPFGQFQQQKMYEGASSDKAASERRSTVASLLKGISDEDKNKLWEEAKFWFKQGATNPLTQQPFESPEEAFDSLIRKSLMSKEKVLTPEGQWNTTYEDAMDYWKSEAKQGKVSLGEAEILATHQANKKHKLPKALVDAMDPSLDYIDSMSVDRKDGVLTINSIGVNFRYREGKIYLNLEDQQYYKLNADGKTFTVVDITDFQN